MVFPDYRTVLGLDALVRHARTDDFRQAVDVDGVESHRRFDLRAHRLGPRLRAENADAQRARRRVETLPHELFGDREQIRRRDHDDVGLEIADQLHLLRRLSARHRHDGAAETLGAVVRAEAAGEQTVAVRDVHDVAGTAAGRANRARHEQRPRVDVLRGVADDRRLARRAARCVHAHDLLARHGEHAERIVGAQIVLHRERKLREIVERAQVLRMHAGGAEALAIVSDVLVRVPHATIAGAAAAGRAARRCSPSRSARVPAGFVRLSHALCDRCRRSDASGRETARHTRPADCARPRRRRRCACERERSSAIAVSSSPSRAGQQELDARSGRDRDERRTCCRRTRTRCRRA